MDLNIGERISAYRKVKGFTQEQLGEMVGVSGQAVSKWENGGVPDTYLLPEIAKVLGVSVDALFGMEKKVSDYSKDEILDILYEYCRQHPCCKKDDNNMFLFLFEMLWVFQCQHFDYETRPLLSEVIEKNSRNPQITSEIIRDEGTTYLTLVKDFPFFCAVRDTPEISKKILSEKNFGKFFSLLADENGLKAAIFTQTTTESSQYTADMMAKIIGIPFESFQKIAPLLVEYGLLHEDTLTLNDSVVKVYHKWNNTQLRPFLIMAYQFINARQCYYNFTSNRTKPYFEYE